MLVDDYAIQVTAKDFWTDPQSMEKRVAKWKQSHNGQNPLIVYLKPNGADWVSFAKYMDMYVRFTKWTDQKGNYPNFVWVTQGGRTPNITTKTAFHLSVESAVGPYNNFTEYYNHILTKTYGHYNDDVYTQLQEIQRLKANLPLNCSDESQLGYAVAWDMGYEAKFIHVKCNKSGEGHVYLQVRGKELGSNWVNVDLAAASSPGSRYPIGKTWCTAGIGGTKISENDPWLLSDDGK